MTGATERPGYIGLSGRLCVYLLVGLPLLGVVLTVVLLTHSPEDSRIAAARIQCESMSELVETYKRNSGRYPTRIEQLTERQANGEGPLTTPEKIIDPWGKPYKIDMRGLRSDTLKAEVYTTTPGGVVVSSFSK